MAAKTFSLPIVGGILAALGASLCCAGPLVLLLLGISGAWISYLTHFDPLRPFLVAAVLVLFSIAGWQVFRPQTDCEPGKVCAIPRYRQRRQVIFGIAAVLAIALVTSNYWIIYLA